MGEAVRFFPSGYNRSGDIRNGSEGIRKLKKLEEAEESEKKSRDDSAIELNTIILAGLERGLTMTDVRRMTIGQVVDFVVDYNKRQKAADRAQERAEKRKIKRKGTQNDINAFFG